MDVEQRQLLGVVRASPMHSVLCSDNFSTELDQLVQFPLSVVGNKRCPLFGCFYVYELRRDMKARPLFGRSPLFGVSVKREFTVLHFPHPKSLTH